ncbi:hypothetical protein [Hymenobacter sublimis]|uniref:DUF4249 family protein n=1 Tax=Hymenobacter sublimis TaxID=2933777 RepID=A0ABY4J8R0_9BACT|nr:hypothetical protein [Hymenobacter sublimis]UPL49198.1 hypothetical protein MWH26_18725 [Hymenobacter sublimis]
MRFRFLVLLLFPALFTACEPGLESGPRVDLIGSSRFSTADRRLTRAGDTVAVKMFAEADDSPITRLTITAEYLPVPEPIIYPTTTDELNNLRPRTYTYLDSVLNPATSNANRVAFEHVLSSRTTAGLEVWRYEATDEEGRSGKRSLRLRYSRSDSAQAYHSYSVPVQAPARGTFGRRSFLALREGLVFPKFSVHSLAANQAIVDLVYLPARDTRAPTLTTALDDTLGLKWSTRRGTLIRRTSLNAAAFSGAATLAAFTTAFTQGAEFTPRTTSTGTLTKGQVIAFQTPAPDSKYGLVLVQDIITTSIPTLVLEVRISK